MVSFLRLIRFPNLVIIMITQYLLYYRILIPPLYDSEIQPALNGFLVFLMILSTVSIAAAGYIINDIYDYEIDKINKPRNLIVERLISRPKANLLYIVLNVLGFLGGAFIAWKIKSIEFLLLFSVTILFMWWYSKSLKNKPLWGNLMIAFCCALVAIMLWVAEADALQLLQHSAADYDMQMRVYLVWAYAVFAFMSTLFREIVKDMEDIKGDKLGGANTLPLAYGEDFSKKVAFGTGISLIVVIVLFMLFMGNILPQPFFNIFLGIGIILPLIYALYELYRSNTKEHYNCVSKISKLIMLVGLLFLFFC